MAGNTKLRGFGANGVVQLERWGKRANVVLEESEVSKLRDACYNELPIGYPEPAPSNILYNETTGLVELTLTPAEAEQLTTALRKLPLTDTQNENLVRDILSSTECAISNYYRVSNGKGEPGIDGDGDVQYLG